MSRIEEALKRASVSSGPRNLYSLKDSRTAVSQPSTLADYPEEPSAVPEVEPSPVIRATPPAPAARPAASVPPPAPAPASLSGNIDAKLILRQATPIAVEQYRRLA